MGLDSLLCMLYVRHMIRTQVYLPEILYKNVRLAARKQNKPAAQIIRELLEGGVKQKTKKTNAGDALLRLAKLAVRKGPRDLSVNIDKYLYEE